MFTIGGVPLKDAKKQAGSFWSYLYPKKEDLDWIKNSAGEIITGANIDSLMPKLDDSSAGNILGKLQEQQKLVDAGTSSWQKYFGNLQDGQKWQIDFVQNTDLQKASLDDVKVAQDKGRQAAIAHNAALKQQTLGAKAASVGMKALSVVGNMAIIAIATWLISTLISGISKAIGAFDEMSQKADEATSKYKEQAESIEEYKNKITELKTALNNESMSYADARDKRNELIEIQKELIDTYGSEAKGIDLVNGSLDEQIGKLEELNKIKRQEWENEVNELSTGQQWQKWLGAAGLAALGVWSLGGTFVAGYDPLSWLKNFDDTTNIERIQKKVENFKHSFILSGLVSDEGLDSEEFENLKTQLDSFKGVSFDGDTMTIEGDAKTVQDTIAKIQTQVTGSREDLKGLDQDLKDVFNSAKKITDTNWDTYNTALQNQILEDEEGLKYYGDLTSAYKAYQEALKDGDKTAISEATENYSQILSDINKSGMDESFKKYFESMYPDVADIVNDWKFEVEIVPKINSNTGGLKDDIEAVKGLTTEEIAAAFENSGIGVSKDQWKAITDLNTEAQTNGLDLTTFLEQLREAGYLTSQLDKDIAKVVGETKGRFGDSVDWDKFFKENSIDTQEELDKWNTVTNGINNAEDAMDAYAEAVKNTNATTVSIDDLKTASDSLSTLSSAFKELSDDGYLTTETISKIQEATKLSGDEWAEYETKLLNAKAGSAEFNQIMGDLTYTILENELTLEGLANADEEYIARVLKERGVLDSVAKAHDIVTLAQYKQTVQTTLATGATAENIKALIDNANTCGITQGAYVDLIAKEILFNNTSLDVSQKIDALQALATEAGIAANNIMAATGVAGAFGATVDDAYALGVRTGENGNVWYNGKDYGWGKEAFDKASNDAVRDAWKKDMEGMSTTYTAPSVDYSGAGGSGSDSSDKNDALDNYLKDAERRYKIHQDETKYINDLNYALQNLVKTEEERLDVTGKVDEAYRDLADNRIKDLEHQMDVKKNLYGDDVDVLAELNEIQRVAKEEADRLRSMGYDDNSNEIQELQKTWLDAETEKLEYQSRQHEKTVNDIEHAIDIITSKNPNANVVDFYRQLQEEFHKEAERLRVQRGTSDCRIIRPNSALISYYSL